ncbi:hypothetical protein [Nocardia sp. NPDC003183]
MVSAAALDHVSAGTVMAAGEKDALLVSLYDNWITAVAAAITFVV